MRKLLCLGLCFLVALAGAQIDEAKAKRSQDVQTKIRQVDLLIQILPLVMTKEQIVKLLPVIEKARDGQRKILGSEDDEIIKLEGKMDDLLKDAFEKGVYPPRSVQGEVFKLTRALSLRRQIARGQLVDDVYDAIKITLNAGQLKAAANSLDWKVLEPNAKIDDTKDEDKIKFFIKQVFLDPLAYDILKKLAK